MRRFIVGLAAVAVLVPGSASAKSVAPSRVQVVAKEFLFALSRHSVPPGPAIIEIVDFGQDPHDMRIQRIGDKHVYGSPIIQPGGHYDLSLKLVPGRYQVWCSVANHRALGMQAVIVVKKKK
jgi:plastocyanin